MVVSVKKDWFALGLILIIAGLIFLSFSNTVVDQNNYVLRGYVDNHVNYNLGLPLQVSVSAYFNADEQFYLNFTKGRFWGNSYDTNNGGMEPGETNFAPNASILPYKVLSFYIYTPSGDVVSSEVYLVGGNEPYAIFYSNQSTDFVPVETGNLTFGNANIEGLAKRDGNYTFTAWEIDPYVLGDINDTYNVVAAPPHVQADPPLTIGLYDTYVVATKPHLALFSFVAASLVIVGVVPFVWAFWTRRSKKKHSYKRPIKADLLRDTPLWRALDRCSTSEISKNTQFL